MIRQPTSRGTTNNRGRLTTSLARAANSEDLRWGEGEEVSGEGTAAPCFFRLSFSVRTVALNSSVWSIATPLGRNTLYYAIAYEAAYTAMVL